MTYSIVARDAETGQLGVAVQSHWFSVGSVVTWAEPGVGAVATQSFAEPAYGPRGLALMRLGVDVEAALKALLAVDAQEARRQVAMVDAQGRVAVHTGAACIAEAGHVTGEAVSAQANMMRSSEVWPAMLEAFTATVGELSERLMAALEAGERAGGDVRGRQSAAMLIVTGTTSSQPWQERVVDLRVDDGRDPLGELRRLLTVHRAYTHMERAEQREVEGDIDGSLSEYQAARPLLQDNDEATFWAGVMLAGSGREDEARALLHGVIERHHGWAELLRRLPSAGLLRGGDVAVERLLT